MKLLKTEITPLVNELVYIEKRVQTYFNSPFLSLQSIHAHPELQLTYIQKGFGKRIIGNTVEPFEAGDMVLVGSNIPHIWISNPAFYEKNSNLESTLILLYINPSPLEKLIFSFKEFENFREVMQQASKGIKILGMTKDLIADKLNDLTDKQGFEKIEGVLQILNLISLSAEKEAIDTNNKNIYDSYTDDRLVNVIKFIQENYHSHISLDDVADIACLTKQSFCRYFKQKAQMNFSQYINNFRISKACELLLQSNLPITDIAYNCGYSSVAHFCKLFKEQTGLSPVSYRKKAR